VPWLVEQRQSAGRASGQLCAFLGARFAGYLVFAAAAWAVGSALPLLFAPSSVLYGVVHLLMAGALVAYALGRWRACAASAVAAPQQLVTIGVPASRVWAPMLGFLTGLSLCPPFLTAGVRAAELHSLPLALGFFSLFFVGTVVWFAPFAAFGCVRWKQPVTFVARITLFILAAYYGYLGLVILLGRMLYGR
jgi:hypothetical protein